MDRKPALKAWRRMSNRLCALVAYLVPSVLAAQGYEVAFNSFAPANTDVFLADGSGANPRPLIADPTLEYNASFSSDGAWVIFTSERAGSADIYRVKLDGTGLERIVDDPAFDDQGAISPDGNSVAFVSSRSGQADIWVLDLTTRSARNVTDTESGEFRPAWSPSGQWIAFVSDRAPPRTSCVDSGATTGPGPFVTPQYTGVFVVRADGTDLRRISTADETAGGPAWSTDEKLIFHSAGLDQVCNGGLMFATGTSQVVAVDVATGERVTMTNGGGLKLFPKPAGVGTISYVTSTGVAFTGAAVADGDGQFGRPAWSSDGQAMVFHRDAGRRGDPQYTAVRKVSRDADFSLIALTGHTSFSPDGSRIVFGRTNFATGSAGSGTLVVANADGSNQRTIFEAAANDNLTSPAWSPRGDRIVFSLGAFFRRAGSAPARLMSIRPDGSAPTSLSDGMTNDGMASWSPDGRELVFRVADGPTRGLYILDLTSRERRRLPTGSDRDTFPYWSPRGDWITFTSQRDGDYEIYRIRPDGSGLARLTRAAGHDAHASVSPDGEWIAFATSRQGFKDEALGLIVGARPPPFQSYGEVAVMRIDGSDVRMLTDNSVEEGVPVWVPRGTR
jgi:Tol biopolymer transport system component